MHHRQAAVAGLFYPGEPSELQAAVNHYLESGSVSNPMPKALIVPHAGYPYSGSIAGRAYASLGTDTEHIKRVVLLGPSHRLAFTGLAISTADSFCTPLGDIPLDREAIQAILPLPQVHSLDEAHSQEHSLEVQLPFLQSILQNFKLIPIVVGDATASEVDEVLRALWGGQETLIVVSTDLSHYHDYDTSRLMDRRTAEAILDLNPDNIDYEDACGRNPLRGLLQLARERQFKISLLDLKNSGDTEGSKDRVVGYASFALFQ